MILYIYIHEKYYLLYLLCFICSSLLLERVEVFNWMCVYMFVCIYTFKTCESMFLNIYFYVVLKYNFNIMMSSFNLEIPKIGLFSVKSYLVVSVTERIRFVTVLLFWSGRWLCQKEKNRQENSNLISGHLYMVVYWYKILVDL